MHNREEDECRGDPTPNGCQCCFHFSFSSLICFSGIVFGKDGRCYGSGWRRTNQTYSIFEHTRPGLKRRNLVLASVWKNNFLVLFFSFKFISSNRTGQYCLYSLFLTLKSSRNRTEQKLEGIVNRCILNVKPHLILDHSNIFEAHYREEICSSDFFFLFRKMLWEGIKTMCLF